MADRVLLTGISGFLGGHIALQLLAAGYAVRGSVRTMDKAESVRRTLSRAGAAVERLEFVALDLLADEGWAEATTGVRFVQHTASPFILRTPKDPQVLIRPAVDGTRRAITAALAAGVERIVLTSSIAAIQYGHADYSTALDETDWTNLESPTTGPYPASKTLAETEAWRLMQQAGRHEGLAVINPAGILGPLLDDDPGTSSTIVRTLMIGWLPLVPKLAISIVDVRDVAALHVDAMTNPDAAGQRCIASAETLPMAEIGAALRGAFPNRRIPTGEIPDIVVELAARFSRQVRDNKHELATTKRLDTSRAPQRLGRQLISAQTAAIATATSLIEHKLV